MRIPFNKPYLTGREFEYVSLAVQNNQLSGDGEFTRKCQSWLEERGDCRKALLTHSCTAALEMAAILADCGPGDEVILPSYTFVSTANAFVLRGAIPVFVDIRPDTLNIDEKLIEAAITPRTKAIVVVHYAGVGCEMDAIMDIAKRNGLLVIEDAAQGIEASYKGRRLGSIGDLAAVSFHETKNVICGEGGALLINNPAFAERAEIVWEKGTNRKKFFRGQVDKYTWVDIGSSYLPGEVTAAFLFAQLEHAQEITARRMEVWHLYANALSSGRATSHLSLPQIPADCEHNAHMFYVLTADLEARTRTIENLNRKGVNAVFHYIPLHSSVAGRKFGRSEGPLAVTDHISDSIIRLPLWVGMGEEHVQRVADTLLDSLR